MNDSNLRIAQANPSTRWTKSLLFAFLATITANVLTAAEQTRSTIPTKPAAISNSRLAVRDIRLQEGGVLNGRVINVQGTPQANALVQVVYRGGVVATVQTNGQSRFVLGGLNAGIYQLQSHSTSEVVRLWKPNAAPTSAQNEAVLVVDRQGDQGVRPVDPGIIPGESVVVPGDPVAPCSPCQPSCFSCCPKVFHPGRAILLGGAGIGLYYALDHNPPGS